MQIVNTNLFKGACGFTLTLKKMGNSRKGDIQKVSVDADKKRLRLSKQLIDSPEYEKVIEYQRTVYNWCMERCNPSFFKKGFYLVKLDMVEEFESQLKLAIRTLNSKLIPELQKAYPGQVQEARVALNGQFREKDYPDVDKLPELFGIDWNWIGFSVPENLPEELKRAEQAKLEKQFQDAEQQIISALREGFQKLIDHAIERLKVEPGEKPKKFDDTLVKNIQDFIGTFNARNLLNDTDLEDLVAKAKEVLKGVTAPDLRTDMDVREGVAKQFEEIKKTLDTMIVSTPTRKFSFDD